MARVKVGIGVHESRASFRVIAEAEILALTVVGDRACIAERLERITR